ncbi:MAG: hypothetical protein GYA47_04640 [Desulfovibrio sp.]|nr:hypothetical protein [Desulfovibrio sp.]
MGSGIGQTILEFQQALPAVFRGTELDRLTGKAIRWRSIQNLRSKRVIPSECFIYSGSKVLVRRDLFLKWWRGTLRENTVAAKRRARHDV